VSTTDPEDEPSGATTHPVGSAGTGPKKLALSAQAAAEALDIPYRTLMASIHKGQIGAIKIGRYYQVPVAEIERVLAPAIKIEAA
jgi:excisionase family DNA binding protein